MANIEGITGAGMAYQGSVSTAQVRTEAAPKQETTATEATAARLEAGAVAITSHEIDGGSAGDGGAQGQAQSQTQNILEKQARIRKAVEDINKNAVNSEAVFGIHDATNRVTIKIVDKETKEVIKELPPEKTLDMIAKVWEMAGLLVDERR